MKKEKSIAKELDDGMQHAVSQSNNRASIQDFSIDDNFASLLSIDVQAITNQQTERVIDRYFPIPIDDSYASALSDEAQDIINQRENVRRHLELMKRPPKIVILPGVEESWLASERKSGRTQSDYQSLLFADRLRKYSLAEWRALYCLKHADMFRPSWAYLLEHYSGLLMRDVVMVLPKEKVSLLPDYYEPLVAEKGEISVAAISLFSQSDQRSHVVEVLNDWLTISMFDPLAEAARGIVIVLKTSEDLEPINVMPASTS